jgi:glycosyltransferase involved in cell wall biosynthesis
MHSLDAEERVTRRDGRYRIGFLQTVMVGNMYRYQMLRRLVEQDATIEPHWFPLRSWVIDDWLRFTPGWVRVRVRHLLDSARLFTARGLDAVVVHAPEMYGPYGTFHSVFKIGSALVENSDAPTIPHGKIGAALLQRAQRRTALFVPWSRYVSDGIQRTCPDALGRMHVVHPGLPLEQWPARNRPARALGQRFRLLFVGGDALRKGLDTLVEAMAEHLADVCELDVATQATGLPDALARRMENMPNVRVHLDRQPGSPQMQQLFREADALVLPTRYDLSPWVIIEALATGVPVIASDVGGISDMVVDGVTGFLTTPGDATGLARAIESLRTLPPDRIDDLVRNGRRHVEEHFDASKNTALLLDLVKRVVDDPRRSAHAGVTTRWRRRPADGRPTAAVRAAGRAAVRR